MAGKSVHILAIALFMVAVDNLTEAAPSSSISIASAGSNGAMASSGAGAGAGAGGDYDDDSVFAGSHAGAGNMNTGGGGGASLLRSGGGMPPPSSSSKGKTQSVGIVSGSNGDTAILQQSGDQPAKVYKISGGSG